MSNGESRQPPGENHAPWTELAELAPLEGLRLEEHLRVAAHQREGCAVCAATARAGTRSLEVLALAGPELMPSPGRREALLAAAEASSEARPRSSTRRVGARPPTRRRVARRVAMAAGIVALLASGVLAVTARRELARQRELQLALQARLTTEQQRVGRLSKRLAALEGIVDVATEPDLRSLVLSGEAAFRSSSVRAWINSNDGRIALIARGLPSPPPGTVYQLWLLEGGAPRSLAVFAPDASGRATCVSANVRRVEPDSRLAVSVEPSGGVPLPTGPIVLVSR